MVLNSDKEKLKSYTNDASGKLERDFVFTFFSEHEDDPELKELILDDWDEMVREDDGESENIELSSLLDRIHHHISLNEPKREPTPLRRLYHWYSGLAALLLIPLIVAGTYLLLNITGSNESFSNESTHATLFAPLGSRVKFSLPDGTTGWLNSGSSLDYQTPFRKNRKLNLRGEAYFDVAHNANQPFEISSGKALIKVLGTKFNLSAYPVEKYIEVVLEEGKVVFSLPEESENVVIKPSERVVFEDGKISRSTTDPSKFTAWVEGKLVFRGDPMAEVARRIERWYNVDVRLVDEEIDNYVFRGTFQDDSLEEVLRVLCMTSPLKYKIIERKLTENGTVQKGLVLLSVKDFNN